MPSANYLTHTSTDDVSCCHVRNQYVFLYSFGPLGATEAESADESYAFGLE